MYRKKKIQTLISFFNVYQTINFKCFLKDGQIMTLYGLKCTPFELWMFKIKFFKKSLIN